LCCEASLPSGFHMAICTDPANCTMGQQCDPNAVSSGCLTGSCSSAHVCL
jgi:hypothetical protein